MFIEDDRSLTEFELSKSIMCCVQTVGCWELIVWFLSLFRNERLNCSLVWSDRKGSVGVDVNC